MTNFQAPPPGFGQMQAPLPGWQPPPPAMMYAPRAKHGLWLALTTANFLFLAWIPGWIGVFLGSAIGQGIAPGGPLAGIVGLLLGFSAWAGTMCLTVIPWIKEHQKVQRELQQLGFSNPVT